MSIVSWENSRPPNRDQGSHIPQPCLKEIKIHVWNYMWDIMPWAHFWRQGCHTLILQWAFGICKLCSLPGLNNTGSAASLLTFQGGLPCDRRSSVLVGASNRFVRNVFSDRILFVMMIAKSALLSAIVAQNEQRHIFSLGTWSCSHSGSIKKDRHRHKASQINMY